ncbi:hypothetical protein [Paenibacillus sp. y28]|uniref:hypothetical protein n=1 Tax=Paenibacillus sp. y28 TaxID=3129110 RepID=UPI00301773AF
MKKWGAIVLTLLTVAVLVIVVCPLQYTQSKPVFYGITGLALLLGGLSIVLVVRYCRRKVRSFIVAALLGVGMVLAVKEAADQQQAYALQAALQPYLPGAPIEITGQGRNLNGAKPVQPAGPDGNPDNREPLQGVFVPPLPHYYSEAVLIQPHPGAGETISYRFRFRGSYMLDGHDVSEKWCALPGLCDYLYHGAAEVDAVTGEVVGLAIVYRAGK